MLRNDWTPLLKMLAADNAWNKEFFLWLFERGTEISEPVSGGPSMRLENGVNCLHLMIAALQPVSLSNSKSCYLGPHYLLAIANIPAQADNFTWGEPASYRVDRIDLSKRHVQKEFLRVLVTQHPAVARHWGTHTNIANYTGNIELWCSVLEDCNINVERFLAYDFLIPRSMEIQTRHKALTRYQENR